MQTKICTKQPFFTVTLLSAVLLATFGAGCTKEVKAPQNASIERQKITGLKTPESVVQAKDGRILCLKLENLAKRGMEKSH